MPGCQPEKMVASRHLFCNPLSVRNQQPPCRSGCHFSGDGVLTSPRRFSGDTRPRVARQAPPSEIRNRVMSVIVVDTVSVHIPSGIDSLESFRHWAHSAAFPETGRIGYVKGEVWVDMSKEQFSHNQVKGEIAAVLTALVKAARSGR